MLLQKIIVIIPIKIPIIHTETFEMFNVSGIKSKQITAVISPAANSKINPKDLFDFKLV